MQHQAEYVIHQWRDISDRYKETILIGNGASIAVNDSFNYRMLFEHALEGGLTEEIGKVFKHFSTSNFEFVLRLLWQATHVNHALNIEDTKSEKAYQEVRDCLIKAVREIHPSYESTQDQLPHIYDFLKEFKTIVSLNYDLIIYWVMMYGNDLKQHLFKDCFINGSFYSDWKTLRKARNKYDIRPISLVFYPHGNLMLSRDIQDQELKLNSGGSTLLQSILDSWASSNYVPLFVSEGTKDQKKIAIKNSFYLSTIFREVLPDYVESLAILGWSLSDNDFHIFEQLRTSILKRIAISVFNSDQEYCDRVFKYITKNIGQKLKIEFFHVDSTGSWNIPKK